MTSRPAASSTARFASSRAWFGSSRSVTVWQRTRPGATNAATLSTCPPVRSSSRPCSSQIVRSMPRNSRNAASQSARDMPGLRLSWRIVGSTAISVPSPSVLTAPPSSTIGTAMRSSPSNSARPAPIVSPWPAAGSVVPQPLKRKSTATSSFGRLRAKIGPESRSQASPSGSSTTSTLGPAVRGGLRVRTRASRPRAPARSPRSPSRRARSRSSRP